MNKRRAQIFGIICAILTAGVALFMCLRSTPEKAQAQYIDDFLNRDWGHIYDGSADILFKDPEVTRDQYTIFMTSLSQYSSPDVFTAYDVEEMSLGNGIGARGSDAIAVYFRDSHGFDERPLILVCHAMNSREGWQISPMTAITVLAEYEVSGEREKWDRVYQAMNEAQIDRMQVSLHGAIVHRAKLKKYLDGMIQLGEAFSS